VDICVFEYYKIVPEVIKKFRLDNHNGIVWNNIFADVLDNVSRHNYLILWKIQI
jgi:hypothetical protein